MNKPVLKKLFSAILKIYKGVAYYEKSHILKSIVIKRTSAECTALLHSAPLHEVSSISEQASRLGTCETAKNQCEVTQRVCFNLRVCTSLLSADAGSKSCTLKLCACERHLHVMFLSFPWVAIFVSYILCHTPRFSKKITPMFCVIHIVPYTVLQ